MPVTIITAKHGAQEIQSSKLGYKAQPSKTPEELFHASARREDREQFHAMIQSSFADVSNKTIYPASNGFVDAAIVAYNHHHHLILRPEDIWFSILNQFSLYVNVHAEALRSTFVSHKGKRKLVLMLGPTTIDTFDWSIFATQMTKLLSQNINDPHLRSWILPSFSTTTPTDTVTASILMMGTLQKYFEFIGVMCCGIPSVTLQGTKADWQDILSRLPKLASFGSEPAQFAKLLTPVLEHFIASFDNPSSKETISFWSRICSFSPLGSGSDKELSGWITAFCFWDPKGRCYYEHWRQNTYRRAGCKLGEVEFHKLPLNAVPSGSSSVPVVVNDNGTMYDTLMVAGSVGIEVSASGGYVVVPAPSSERIKALGQGHAMNGLYDTLQPASGWWMIDTGDKGVKKGNFEGVMDLKEGDVVMGYMDSRLDVDDRIVASSSQQEDTGESGKHHEGQEEEDEDSQGGIEDEKLQVRNESGTVEKQENRKGVMNRLKSYLKCW